MADASVYAISAMGIADLLVVLHMVMAAPIWFLIARLSSLVGGSGGIDLN